MPNDVALARNTELFVEQETTAGTAVVPTAGGLVRIYGSPVFSQPINWTDDDQHRGSRSMLPRIKGHIPSGTFSFTIRCKPSGTAGTVPEAHNILKGIFGTYGTYPATLITGKHTNYPTITATQFGVASPSNYAVGDGFAITVAGKKELTFVSAVHTFTLEVSPALSAAPATGAAIGAGVTYKFNDALPSFTVYEKVDHTVRRHTGCVFDTATVRIAGGEVVSIDIAGRYFKQIHAGTDALTTNITAGQTTIPVNNYRRYRSGAHILIGAEQLQVSAEPTNNNVPVTRAFNSSSATSAATAAAVSPYLPTGTEDGQGNEVHGRFGSVELDGSNLVVLESTLSINNAVNFHDDEKTGGDYTTSFSLPNLRVVESTLRMLFRRNDLRYFQFARGEEDFQLVTPAAISINDELQAGKIVGIKYPQARMSLPEVSGDADKEISIDVKVNGTTTGSDEAYLAFV